MASVPRLELQDRTAAGSPVRPNSDDRRAVHDPTIRERLEVGRVEAHGQGWPSSSGREQKSLTHPVVLLAETADPALGNAAGANGTNQPVDRTHGAPFDVSLLYGARVKTI